MPDFETPKASLPKSPEDFSALADELELVPKEFSIAVEQPDIDLEAMEAKQIEETEDLVRAQEATATTDQARATEILQQLSIKPVTEVAPAMAQEMNPDVFNSVSAPDLGEVSSSEFTREAIKNITGGSIPYVNGEGFKIDKDADARHLQEQLALAEETYGAKASEYVKLTNGEWGAEATHNVAVDDERGFEQALAMKKLANENGRKKFFKRALLGATASAGAGITAMGVGGAGSAAAAFGGAAIIAGGGGFLVLGAAGYGIKKLYDRYKEKKSAKDFATASVAQQAKRSLFRPFNSQVV